jgi:hypothetical protein
MENLPWVREEVVLLLDLYIQSGRQQLPLTHKWVIALSELLRRLPFHLSETRSGSYSTEIRLKIGNLLALDLLYGGVDPGQREADGSARMGRIRR